MNREDIIRMAREAGFEQAGYLSFQEITHRLESFANLVASAEREECKKLCTWKTGNEFVDDAISICYRAIDLRGQA
jgi:hypothetical protein